MTDTPETQTLRENILEWLDEQGLDPEDRKARGDEVRRMHYAELVTKYPQCAGE